MHCTCKEAPQKRSQRLQLKRPQTRGLSLPFALSVLALLVSLEEAQEAEVPTEPLPPFASFVAIGLEATFEARHSARTAKEENLRATRRAGCGAQRALPAAPSRCRQPGARDTVAKAGEFGKDWGNPSRLSPVQFSTRRSRGRRPASRRSRPSHRRPLRRQLRLLSYGRHLVCHRPSCTRHVTPRVTRAREVVQKPHLRLPRAAVERFSLMTPPDDDGGNWASEQKLTKKAREIFIVSGHPLAGTVSSSCGLCGSRCRSAEAGHP